MSYIPAVCHVVPLVRLPPCVPTSSVSCCATGQTAPPPVYLPAVCHVVPLVRLPPCVPTSSVPYCATGQTVPSLCTYQQCAMLCHWSDYPPPCVSTSSGPCSATGQTANPLCTYQQCAMLCHWSDCPLLCTYLQCAMLCHWSDCPPPRVPTSSVPCCATGQTAPPPPVYLPAVCHVVPLVRLPPCVPTSSVPYCATGQTVPSLCTYQQCAMLCHWSDYPPPPVYLPAVCHAMPLVRLPPPPVYLPAVCHVVPLVRMPPPLCTYLQCAMLCHWSDCPSPCVPTSSVP